MDLHLHLHLHLHRDELIDLLFSINSFRFGFSLAIVMLSTFPLSFLLRALLPGALYASDWVRVGAVDRKAGLGHALAFAIFFAFFF